MTIRSKLMFMLLAIAILPLCLVSALNILSLHKVQNVIETQTRQTLVSRAKTQLKDIVENYTAIVQGEARTFEMAVQLIAERAGVCYDSRSSASKGDVFTNDDFNSHNPLITDLEESSFHVRREGDTWKPIPVSREHAVCVIPQEADMQEIDRELSIVSCLGDIFESLPEREDIFPLWQYVGFESGLHIAYPGHGGYPEGYDPRERYWYIAAREAGTFVWNPPHADASSGAVIMSLSCPVRGRPGEIVGVAGLDVRISDVVRDVEIAEGWSTDAEVMMVRPGDFQDNDKESLVIIAQMSYQEKTTDWKDSFLLESIRRPEENQALFSKMLTDMQNGQSGVVELSWKGRMFFWAYGPGGPSRASILLLVPKDDVMAHVAGIESTITDSLFRFAMVAGATVFVVGCLIVCIAVLSSRSITRPIAQLSEIARRIARGDLSMRATVSSRDEIGQLGKTVNEMIPKLQDRLRMKDSLSLAMEVQRHLLPSEPPTIPGLDIAGNSQACDETGGDYYDYFSLGDEKKAVLGVCIGDVTGHGAAAALLMASGRSILRQQVSLGHDEGTLITNVNHFLSADTSGGRFMTLVYMSIDPGDRQLRWANAGHERPILYSVVSDSMTELVGGGIPLGLDSNWQYEAQTHDLSDGEQILVLGTDGITEARNESEEMFGKERLLELIREHSGLSASEIVEEIRSDLRRFCGAKPQLDDITLVVIRVLDSEKS